MLIVTINEIPGKKLEALGVVRGSTVQSRQADFERYCRIFRIFLMIQQNTPRIVSRACFAFDPYRAALACSTIAVKPAAS